MMKLLFQFQKLKIIQTNEIVILTTGSQGEPIEVLQKMAKQTHKFVNIQKGDTVVFAVSAIKGNEIFIIENSGHAIPCRSKCVSVERIHIIHPVMEVKKN